MQDLIKSSRDRFWSHEGMGSAHLIARVVGEKVDEGNARGPALGAAASKVIGDTLATLALGKVVGRIGSPLRTINRLL